MSQKRFYGILFASPWIIGMVVFLIYPVAMSLYYSLTEYDILSPPFFIGWENYQFILSDNVFWISLKNTLYLFCIGLPLQLITAFFLALLLNTKVKGMALYRSLFFLPTIIPTVVTAMLWRWIFNADVGMLNGLLYRLGIHGPAWLADPAWSKPSLILMNLWGVGGSMLIFLASLQDVPRQLYEAAEIDGASPWRKTFHITLPMISPVILFNLIQGIIGTFMYFTEPFIMTGGGPLRSTTFYSMYLYENAFQFFRLGYASAMAWVLFVIVLSLSLLALTSSPRWTYYGGR